MSGNKLLALCIERFRKKRIWIIIGTAIGGILFLFFSIKAPVKYISTATIFPLSSSSDRGAGSSVLSALLGNTDIGNSFTDENSVNIIELAQSRTIREEVAGTVIKSDKGDRTIAELLLDAYNNNRSFYEFKIDPDDEKFVLLDWAVGQLKDNLVATITQTNSFQLQYTGRTEALVRDISYAYVNEISQFYIQLKREKAKADFDFATKKVDSLRNVMGEVDSKLISNDDKMLFTDLMKLEYKMPAENMIADKQMLRAQFITAVSNQQSAAYTLQKATPVVKLLDKPDPPFARSSPSIIIFFPLGIILGFLITLFILTVPLLRRYTRTEISNFVEEAKREG